MTIQYFPRLRGIPIHLRLQGIQIGKFLLIAQLGDEFHFDAASIQIAIEVEQMRFQQRLAAVEHRSHAETGYARSRLRTKTMNSNRKDTLHR